jgi:hypothetical protein
VKNSDYKSRVVKSGGSVEPSAAKTKVRVVREPAEAASAG